MLYEWLLENREKFIDMIPSETRDNKLLTLAERNEILTNRIEKIKVPKYRAGDLEISSLCIMLNINIYLYIFLAYKTKIN